MKNNRWFVPLAGLLACAPVLADQAISSLVIAAPGPVRPVAMAADGEGGAIAVGSIYSTREAWAAKVHPDGRVAWTYTRPFSPPELAALGGGRASGSVLGGAVAMRDGSTVLCGKLPRAAHSALPTALLVHLDKAGKTIGESFIDFQNDPPGHRLRYAFVGCLRQDDGVLAVAYEEHLDMQASPDHPIGRASYAIAGIDADGALAWSTVVPAGLRRDQGIDPESFGFARMGAAYVLLATSNIDTELLVFDGRGAVRAERVLAGRWTLVENAAAADALALIGAIHPATDAASIVTVDDKLDEKSRKTGKDPLHFIAHRAFLMESGNLALFGMRKDGWHSLPSVMQLDANVGVISTRDVSRAEDDSTIRAATAVGSDHFIFATTSVAAGAGPGARIGQLSLGRDRSGLAP